MIQGVILDLDGTVYMGDAQIPGAADFVRLLREREVRPLFVTNRANRKVEHICLHLGKYGIECSPGDVLTSAEATAEYLGSGTVFCVGEEGLLEALVAGGLTLADEAVDYVVVSFDRTFTYRKLERACALIDAGATFVATNPDAALKVDGGVAPGTGAIVAAVAAGCGVDPIVIGKPEKRIMETALDRLRMPPDEVVCIGDNIDTDIPAGARAGMRTALLLTGISNRDALSGAEFQPTWVAEDYEELVRIMGPEL